ncbi:hypothetical protein KEJ15_08020 [Candidatus Bathyarchaeota archaeon]|nr:hypothetical protein [Candidatus Bathyarchaeota archaeon]
MNLREMMKNVDYPFGRFLVSVSAIIAIASTAFAVVILREEDPNAPNPAFLGIPMPILSYFSMTAILTLLILLIKVRLYSAAETAKKTELYVSGAEETAKDFKRSLTLLYAAVVVLIILIPALLFIVPQMWWFISITSFVSGINFSEVIIYLFSRKR